MASWIWFTVNSAEDFERFVEESDGVYPDFIPARMWYLNRYLSGFMKASTRVAEFVYAFGQHSINDVIKAQNFGFQLLLDRQHALTWQPHEAHHESPNVPLYAFAADYGAQTEFNFFGRLITSNRQLYGQVRGDACCYLPTDYAVKKTRVCEVLVTNPRRQQKALNP